MVPGFPFLTWLFFWLLPFVSAGPVPLATKASEMVYIPSGYYHDFMSESKHDSTRVEAFYIDKYPVTNTQFAAFTEAQPQWRKENIKVIYAGKEYLQQLGHGLPDEQKEQPVTNVSWYAANAYCKCMGKRIPTLAEWEYAAAAPIKAAGNRLLSKDSVVLRWYSMPAPQTLPPVGKGYKNTYGVSDMHGLIWEWVQDFNSVIVGKDTRNPAIQKLFCGSASAGVADPSDYASFVRYAFRSSINARYTGKNLGFRCAKSKGD